MWFFYHTALTCFRRSGRFWKQNLRVKSSGVQREPNPRPQEPRPSIISAHPSRLRPACTVLWAATKLLKPSSACPPLTSTKHQLPAENTSKQNHLRKESPFASSEPRRSRASPRFHFCIKNPALWVFKLLWVSYWSLKGFWSVLWKVCFLVQALKWDVTSARCFPCGGGRINTVVRKRNRI